jgi:hypothetical protein
MRISKVVSFVAPVGPEERLDHAAEWGGRDDLPGRWHAVDRPEFEARWFAELPTKIEDREIEGQRTRLFWFGDGSGVALMEGGRYFSFGCAHEWRPMTETERGSHEWPGVEFGTMVVCTHCGVANVEIRANVAERSA